MDQSDNNSTQDNGSTIPTLGLGTNPTFTPITTAPTADEVTLPTVPDEQPLNPTVNAATTTPPQPVVTSDLNSIKMHALEQLSPLVDKLDQTPEERYKTLMMMIQASDNQTLVGDAYQAAQQITDEKAKAEAILNIINEINYFTQKAQ
jgi:hypothetical protein